MMATQLPIERAAVLSRLSEPVSHGMPLGHSMPPANKEEVRRIWATVEPTLGQRMLYVHIPFCLSRCLFCSFYQNKTSNDEMCEYTDYLLRELKMMADSPSLSGVFDTVYFGGGTPTDLSAKDLARLIRAVCETVTLTTDVEFTVEGRLFGFNDEKVRACLDEGANRFSFGIQSFNTSLRQAMGRRLPREKIIERINRIKEIGGDHACLVADLIYGLPEQSQEGWLEDIRTVHDETQLDGVDLYRLKMLPDTPLTKKYGTLCFSDEELIARQTEANFYLSKQNWKRLSVTHWGRGALERNRYNHQTKTGADTVPFGCGAGGGVGAFSFMQMMPLESYFAQLDAGDKPVGMVMPRTPNPLRNRVVDQMERCFFDPSSVEVGCSQLIENWTQAGVWSVDHLGICQLTELGQFYQPRLTIMLTTYLLKGLDCA